MTHRRFASWPEFNGQKVVLDNDERLNAGVPTYIPPGVVYEVGDDLQALAAVNIRVDGTVVVDGTLVMM